MNTSEHLTPDDLDAALEQSLAAMQPSVHLETCEACQDLVDAERELVGSAERDAPVQPVLAVRGYGHGPGGLAGPVRAAGVPDMQSTDGPEPPVAGCARHRPRSC